MRITLIILLVFLAAPAASTASCVPASTVAGLVEESPELSKLDPDGNRDEGLKLLLARSARALVPDATIRISAQGVSAEGAAGVPHIDATTIFSAINAVDAELRCHPIGTNFVDTFTRTATIKPKVIPIGRGTSADITVSWRSPSDIISIRKLRLDHSSKGLTVKRTAGRTWVTLHITSIKRGKLRFNLALKQMASVMFGSIKATTQVATYKN